MLLIHIAIAISSIGFTGFSFLHPSKRKLLFSYLWVAATIATGSYLVVIKPSHMVSACITGLVYLGFVMSGIIATHVKLARLENSQ
jgi:hypothetical protein